ncbi:MAG: leucyl aminopeptidase [Candidatus Omnitrophica bacterium]|nr:leucyl aminopeptidase [Candidatus Omnitrophota bacterium]
MRAQFQAKSILDTKTDLMAVAVFEETKAGARDIHQIDKKLNGAVRKLLEGAFKGKKGESFLMYTAGRLPFHWLLVVGMGKEDKYQIKGARGFVGAAVRAARRCNAKKIAFPMECLFKKDLSLTIEDFIQQLAEAASLANFSFDKYKSRQNGDGKTKTVEEITFIGSAFKASRQALQRGVNRGRLVAESANLARILSNEPSNVMTPAAMARAALEATRGMGVRCTIRDERWLHQKKMNAVLAVAQGSENRPRFVVLEYQPAGVKESPIVLVGKGVTFDSGGISIKPSEGMEKMKYDMSGGAVVIAVIQALAKLKVRQRAVGIIPLVENMPSGAAQRPGDVIRTYSGKYVEVLNTDAEGRLILSDALAYAQNFKPKAIIDLATLTGACVVALGHEAIGMMGTDDSLKARIKEAGERTGERVWELPLWEEYFEAIKSEVADIKNVGARGAGTITAAMFLKEFVGDYPWVHLDIAGTAWVEKNSHPYLNPGPSGVGVRLLVEAIRNW